MKKMMTKCAAVGWISVVLLGCRYDKIATDRDGYWYTSREGDDLIYIAIDTCVNPGDIRKANNMDYNSTIRPGMRIWIPKK